VSSRGDQRAIRIIALGFAAAVHLLVLLLILTRHPLLSPTAPVIDLELAPRATLPELPSVPARRAPGRPSAARPTPPAAILPREAPQDLNAPPPIALPAPAPAAPAASPNLGAALRGSVGCGFADILSPAEREACRERLAKGRSSDPAGALPAVSPQARAAFDAGARRDDWIHQPFLAEKPKNGCRPMVVHQDFAPPGAAGGHEDWSTSIVCGKTF
jgi:hypothetical protein